MTAGLKNMIEADNITFNIGIGIGDAVAYTSLCRKGDHHIKMIVSKKSVNKNFVCKVSLEKSIYIPRTANSNLLQAIQTIFLNTNIIIIIHAV